MGVIGIFFALTGLVLGVVDAVRHAMAVYGANAGDVTAAVAAGCSSLLGVAFALLAGLGLFALLVAPFLSGAASEPFTRGSRPVAADPRRGSSDHVLEQ